MLPPAPRLIQTLIEQHRAEAEAQVRRIVRNRLRDAEAVEDIVQGVWVVVLKKAETDPNKFDSKESLVAFVTGVAGMKCKEYWKKHLRNPTPVEHAVIDSRASKFVDPDWQRIRELLTCQKVFELLRHVSNLIAAVVRMRCEGRQWSEIATSTTKSMATVHRDYNRGVLTLQKLAEEGKLEAL